MTYRIEQKAQNRQCLMSLEFTGHYKADWEGVPMYFTVARTDSFEEKGREIDESCMSVDTGQHNCEGPLLERMEEIDP